MKKVVIIFLAMLALLLQACAIPPARINWQNEPGKIQRINVNPKSPAAQLM